MLALITGASSGLGKDFAYKFSKEGYDLILVARSKEKLEEIKKDLNTNVRIEIMDLTIKENVLELYEKYKGKIDLLINNAGFGDCGEFHNTDLDKELNMIDLNIVSYHILTKLFLKDFISKNKGEILNVASSAAFQPGPLMATYYSTKSYVYNLTMSIYEELRNNKSKVKVHVLCPGPVDTNFSRRAEVKFCLKYATSDYVTQYAIKQMKKNKLIIVPGLTIKLGVFLSRFVSRKFVIKMIYKIQKKKKYKE